MPVSPTRDEFSTVAKMHLRAAGAAAGLEGGQAKSAAYLAHVATECAIKYRLIAYQNKTRTKDMRIALGAAYDQIFASALGHNLKYLAEQAALARILTSQQLGNLLQSSAWKRMVHDDRPYSLRYGTERISIKHATEEIEFAITLSNVLLKTV